MSEVIFSTDQSKTSLPNLEALKIMNTLRAAVQLRNNSTVIPTLMKFSQRVHNWHQQLWHVYSFKCCKTQLNEIFSDTCIYKYTFTTNIHLLLLEYFMYYKPIWFIVYDILMFKVLRYIFMFRWKKTEFYFLCGNKYLLFLSSKLKMFEILLKWYYHFPNKDKCY
jgi:hypothetical protein